MPDTRDITTQDRILKVAEELFLERGFASSTTVEIARRAGCNQALVHYYFRSKELLFQIIFENKLKLFASTFFTIDQQDGTFFEKLERKIGAHFDILVDNPRLPFMLLNEISTNPKRISRYRDRLETIPAHVVAKFKADLETEIAKGTIRPIKLVDFLLNIIALNAVTFLSIPILISGFGVNELEINEYLSTRRAEVIRTVIGSLRP